MRAVLSVCLALTVSSTAFAGTEKEIKKEIAETTKAIQENCGCAVSFTYSDDFDFTDEYGSDLALHVRKTIESVGEAAEKWCKKGEDFAAKLCLMINSVEVDADDKAKRPYSRAVSRGVIRSYIARKTPKVMSYDGGWVEPFLKTGKMRDRKEDEN